MFQGEETEAQRGSGRARGHTATVQESQHLKPYGQVPNCPRDVLVGQVIAWLSVGLTHGRSEEKPPLLAPSWTWQLRSGVHGQACEGWRRVCLPGLPLGKGRAFHPIVLPFLPALSSSSDKAVLKGLLRPLCLLSTFELGLSGWGMGWGEAEGRGRVGLAGNLGA